MKRLLCVLAIVCVVLLISLYLGFHKKVKITQLRKQMESEFSGVLPQEGFLQKSFEFEVECSVPQWVLKGITIAEYEGHEIIICIFFSKKYYGGDESCGFIGTKAYDFQGQQLQIPENTLNSLAADMTKQIIFLRQFGEYKLDCNYDITTMEWSVALRERRIGDSIPDVFGDENDRSKNLVWEHNLSEYTDFADEWAESLRYVASVRRPLLSCNQMSALSTIISLKTVSPDLRHSQFWGIDPMTGEELFTIAFQHMKYKYMDDLYFDSIRQHSVAVTSQPFKEDSNTYSFFQTWDDLKNDNPAFVYEAPDHYTREELYFINDDIFCIDIDRYTADRRHAVLIYSFSENKIIAGIELIQCPTLNFAALSKDRKKLVVNLLTSSQEGQYFKTKRMKNTIRIYDLGQ